MPARISVGTDEKVRIALINDKQVAYDFCSSKKNDYSDIANKNYLGKGIIFSIGGVRQSGNNAYHFWNHS